jgi:hypothetical protein
MAEHVPSSCGARVHVESGGVVVPVAFCVGGRGCLRDCLPQLVPGAGLQSGSGTRNHARHRARTCSRRAMPVCCPNEM